MQVFSIFFICWPASIQIQVTSWLTGDFDLIYSEFLHAAQRTGVEISQMLFIQFKSLQKCLVYVWFFAIYYRLFTFNFLFTS